MRRLVTAWLALALMACASAPRGPTDAEVRATLDDQLQPLVREVTMGSTEGFLAGFAADGVMVLRGVRDGEGEVLDLDLTGTDQIRSFMNEVGAVQGFVMEVTGFSRSGMEAEQTGDWSIAGEQTGTFVLSWRRTDDETWRIVRWRFDGT
jgi:hypothetical protein